MEQQANIIQEKFNFSEKSIDLLATPSSIDICEGTARSSKTTTLLFKLGLIINQSDHTQFFIAGATAVVVRRNMIDSKWGFKELFSGCVREGTNPRYGNHLVFADTLGREKIIYIFGFKDKARYKTVLGSTLGGGIIDEINIADIDFVNEVFRALVAVNNFWLGATLNPDNPDKEIYKDFINKTRPLNKYLYDIPESILRELANSEGEPIKNAVYWHFNFNDNPIMTQDKIDFFKSLYPEDSFYYASKILGLRGVSEGVVFGKYLNDSYLSKSQEYFYKGHNQVLDEIDYLVKTNSYTRYTIGVDLGSNQEKKGTVMTFTGFNRSFSSIDIIDCYQAVSDEANALVEEICNKIKEWYYQIESYKLDAVYIDGYGAVNILMPTIRKQLASMGINVKVRLSIKFGNAKTKTNDKAPEADRHSRLTLLLLLINLKRIRFKNSKAGREMIRQLKKIVYDPKDNLPLDENTIEMDYYDSLCYTFTPFTHELNNNIYQDEERK